MIKKRLFREYPNPIAHMLAWGFGSGTVVGTLFIFYFWFWVGKAIFYPNILLLIFALIFTPIQALFFGGVPGIIVGLLSGWILSQVLSKALVPLTWQEVQNYRITAYSFVSLVTGVSSTIISLWLSIFWESFGASSPAELFLIPFAATLISIFAAHHYINRLRLWSIAISQKEKHSRQLEDEFESAIVEQENEEDKRKYETS